MRFKWYEEITKSDEITQGDLLFNCDIPIPNEAVYDGIFNQLEEIEEPIDVKNANLIVLSQACDLSNDKIDSVVLCPIWGLDRIIKENPYFKASKARESLRQGKEPSYHLLHSFTSDTISIDYSVVDFHQIYTLPKSFLKKHAINLNSRLRLQPPYREHLSQAFARYFMRVGLPLDIPCEEIKNYQM